MKLLRLLPILTFILLADAAVADRVRPGKVRKLLQRSEVMSKHHVGFALYDLDKRKLIYGHQDDKYFTPASNTKLFTFYAGLKMLRDSIPGLQYIERGDSLFFWGTGDPSLLHPDVEEQPVIGKLRGAGKHLVLSGGRFTGDFYGPGWSYDDYNEYYQPEIAGFPVWGNVVRFSNVQGQITPNVKSAGFRFETDSLRRTGSFRVRRDFFFNNFRSPLVAAAPSYRQEVPFKYSLALAAELLEDTIGREIVLSDRLPDAQYLRTWYSVPKDSLFRRMLLPSDNFIAEQLLLTYAAESGLEMNAQSVIDHVVKQFLADLPDKPQWVDGSGLSRQNLFTPRSMVKLCEKIYDEFATKEGQLFHLLPQGGKTGTIRNLYKSESAPFVFAKTGSLSNVHNLTGYLITKDGKRLIFSFMNNGYTVPTSDIRKEMERILTIIHQEN
ncbi:MAG TPA: D-alanyl-D-alanine carboxypeptidase [Sphingobacteriaceae bacterium]